MIPPVEAAFTRLEDRRRSLAARLAEMTAAQRDFRPQPEAWSSLQVARHVQLTERAIAGSLRRGAGGVPARRTWKQRLGNVVVGTVLRLGIRVRLPIRVVTPEEGLDLEAVSAEWERERAALSDLLEKVDRAALRAPAFVHPVAGPMDLGEALGFLERHFDHHLRQLARIRRCPGFSEAAPDAALPAVAEEEQT